MIDPGRDILREQYGIDATYCNVNALVDELPDGSAADFGCEIYKSEQGMYYAVITSKNALPDDDTIVSSLNTYEQQNEYDIHARYIPLQPIESVEGFKVFRLVPYSQGDKPEPLSTIYDLR